MLIFWDQFGAKTKKSPSQISGRAIKVIRGLRRCTPFSLPPRAIIETEANRHSADADAVFLCSVVAYESELSTLRRTTKNRTTKGCAICSSFVIRLAHVT